MKKLLLIGLSIFVLLGCGKDDDNVESKVTSIKLELVILEGNSSNILVQYVTPDNSSVIRGVFTNGKYSLEKTNLNYDKNTVFLNPYLKTENSTIKLNKKIYINGKLDKECISTVNAKHFSSWAINCD